MNKNYSQVINTLLIIVGGAILIYSIATRESQKYLQIFGFIIIMLGLYRATNYWVETKDDHKEQTKEKDGSNDI